MLDIKAANKKLVKKQINLLLDYGKHFFKSIEFIKYDISLSSS